MSGMKVGQRAWRITTGKHKGRLAWTNQALIDQAIKDKAKLTVQLVVENVPHYGTWGGAMVEVNPKSLNEVWTVAVWSDEV